MFDPHEKVEKIYLYLWIISVATRRNQVWMWTVRTVIPRNANTRTRDRFTCVLIPPTRFHVYRVVVYSAHGTSSYVAMKISCRHGYCSPLIPVMIQSPGRAIMLPSSVET